MRLICPNCDAEYEVDAAAIPDTGRDVQCSSCGHAWFQLPPEIELALEQEDELFGVPLGDDAPATPSVATAPAAEATGDAPAAASPQMRTVDENLMAILREEAEREVQARKAEAAPIETQTEMGLAAPAAKGGLVGAARRIAQMKGIDPDAAPKPPPRPGSRRDMLPDIEEINSSRKGGAGLPPGRDGRGAGGLCRRGRCGAAVAGWRDAGGHGLSARHQRHGCQRRLTVQNMSSRRRR